MSFSNRQKVYQNSGNQLVLRQVPKEAVRILDVGCGAGDNAKKLKQENEKRYIVGITHSDEEAKIARSHIDQVVVSDLESSIPASLFKSEFEVVIASHVMEHLKDPDDVIPKLARLLKPGGRMIIAVPNVVYYKNRFHILFGSFDYTSSGVLDETHLRFFTWETAERFLLRKSRSLTLLKKLGDGAVPLWPIRRLLPPVICELIDTKGISAFPNLFASQVVLVCKKTM